MNACSDREGAREGEQDGRGGVSHCQRGRENQCENRASWLLCTPEQTVTDLMHDAEGNKFLYLIISQSDKTTGSTRKN
jgi:hypothetical protein